VAIYHEVKVALFCYIEERFIKNKEECLE